MPNDPKKEGEEGDFGVRLGNVEAGELLDVVDDIAFMAL